MRGGEAVEIFKIVKSQGMLPTNMEDLMPLSFIGQAAVTFYRQKIKLMDQLNATEEQRKATLRDGQDAGGLLLDIEMRIGELAEKEEKAQSKISQPRKLPNGRFHGATIEPSGKPPKHERLGMPQKRMEQAQKIHKNPEIVEKIKAQAIENEDIPTKTAVLSEIKYQKEKERRIKAEGNKQETPKIVIAIEQVEYINALDKCLRILPQKPPKDWAESTLKEATTKAKLIIKRLEVFNA